MSPLEDMLSRLSGSARPGAGSAIDEQQPHERSIRQSVGTTSAPNQFDGLSGRVFELDQSSPDEQTGPVESDIQLTATLAPDRRWAVTCAASSSIAPGYDSHGTSSIGARRRSHWPRRHPDRCHRGRKQHRTSDRRAGSGRTSCLLEETGHDLGDRLHWVPIVVEHWHGNRGARNPSCDANARRSTVGVRAESSLGSVILHCA